MRVMIPTETGQLEANLRAPQGEPRGAVVLCHPHPVHGGTMDNRVVYRAAKAVADAGFAALRFNFRGVGESSGVYDEGIGEKDDVIVAAGWLANRYPGRDLALIGYSFGAWVGLQVGASIPAMKGLVGLGLPLNSYDFEFLIANSRRSLYIVGDNDEFCSRENLDRFAERLPVGSSVRIVEGSDHFFTGHIETVERLVHDFFSHL